LLATVAGLGACASTPPPLTDLAAADAAIGAARAAGAADFAPVEFRFAEDKRQAASAALDGRDFPLARQLALQAEVDAALAEAKARAAAGRNAVQEKTRENTELRRDLLGGGRP
ncbi:MAG TPA: DUF4398 domain-containing protein, partial [Myxococcota bacterium]|nr:DUF4398 domain-containing protein [Myxococcota bacterium]